MMTADQIATECPACGCADIRQMDSRVSSMTINAKIVATRIQTFGCNHCGKEFTRRNKIADGPFCKRCGNQPVKVGDTIPLAGGKVRGYRHCAACGYRWSTEEA